MSESLKLSPEMQRFAEEQVHAGHYRSVEEVTRAAFALLRENALRKEAGREELRGIFDEMDAGNAIVTTDDEFERTVHESGAKLSGR